MPIRYVFYISAFFLFNTSFSQQKKEVDIIKDSYHAYYTLPRETVYLHLNKTTFLQGEEIWFSGYVYNRRTGLPFIETTNLYCGIYDHAGKQITKELFYVENGFVSGHFKIDPEFEVGKFYIKAQTNWMKNFKEEDSFVQKISIINQAVLDEESNIEKNEYDIQLLPEGGHMIIGTKNSIGFRTTNKNGNGLEVISGQVVNTNGDILVNNITSNKYGIGKFSLKNLQDSDHFINLKLLDGRLISKELPRGLNKGISLSINNIIKDKLIVSLYTNSETLSSIKGKDFYLTIHRDGLMAFHNFQFNAIEKQIYLHKDKLWPGVNILTIFNNDLIPIAERLIFNESKIKLTNISTRIDSLTKLKDSTRIKFNLLSNDKISSHISVSVLPEATKVNNTSKSIISTFLLNPYIKSTVENPAYYFKDLNRKKLYELDMLLITQGWSRYNWKDIFNNPPKEKYAFESGIKIKGGIDNIINGRDNKVAVYNQDISDMTFADIKGVNNNFVIENMYLIKNDSINITLVDNKNEMKKPKTDLVFLPTIVNDSLLPQKNIEQTTLTKIIQDKNGNLNFLLDDDTITLDTVTVSGKPIKSKLTRNLSLSIGAYESVKITEDVLKRNNKLSGLIRRLGFKVRANPIDNTFIILSKVPACAPPIVRLDSFKVDSGGISDYSLDSIDEIYYELDGLEGSCGGTIYIYSGGQVGRKKLNYFLKALITNGFKKTKEYYNPLYSINQNRNDFLEYGTIHWDPNVEINSNGQGEITFGNLGVKRVKLFIEGMALDGSLISEIRTLNLD